MSVSRRQFLNNASLVAVSATLPSWFAEPLKAQAAQPLVRHSVTSTDPEAVKAVQAYRAGVAAMKNRKAHLPTSWQFQANMHAWPGRFGATAADPELEFRDVFATDQSNEPLARKVWGTCSHGDPNVAFLPWHRIYLYFFERMMRTAAGQPASSHLGLPYWDWAKDRTLPLAFREQVNGSQQNNPLYWDVRRQSVTRLSNPTSIPAGTATNGVVTALLGQSTFSLELDPAAATDFNMGLENGPHGDIHVFVGVPPRGMGFFEEAGRDPVFWAHHCNIDRLWSHWRQRQGHVEPLNARVPLDVPSNQRGPWSDVRHTFVDENGKEVQLTTLQVMAAAQILDRGYVYDDLPQVIAMNAAPPGAQPGAAAPAPALPPSSSAASGRTVATSGPVEVTGAAAAVVTLTPTSGAAAPPGTAAVAPTSTKDRILLLKDVAAPGPTGGLYGVYVNLPANEHPQPDSPYFVGTVNTFSASAAKKPVATPGGSSGVQVPHAGHATGVERRLPVAEVLARQGWKEGDPIKVTIAPIPLDNQLAGGASAGAAAAPPSGPVLSIGKIDVVDY